MCYCRRMIDPDAKLTQMLFLFRVILGINFWLIIGKAIYWLTTKMYIDLFSDIICTLLLLGTIYTLFFMYGMLGLFLILYRIVSCVVQLGIFFQQIVYQDTFIFDTGKYAHLGITTFETCFVFFSLIVLFPTYKEMKAQYIENIAGVNYQQQDDNDNDNDNQPNLNNFEHGFQAFQGSGVQVGGSS